jgi:hypothetical protein
MTIDAGPLHPRHGLHAPTAGTPARRPGSVRRTTTVDMLRPDGPTGQLVLVGRGRDLHTGTAGELEVLDTATCRAVVAFVEGRTLRSLETWPVRELGGLAGTSVASGFRGALTQADPGLRAAGAGTGLLHQLLDDLPVTTLVSGHAFSRDLEAGRVLPLTVGRSSFTRNLCAGFVDGGTIMEQVDATGRAPLVTGPAALPLASDDRWAWHAVDDLPPGAMRRSRRVDVTADGRVDVVFRDSHVRPADGLEVVVHEYTVAMTVADGAVTSCEATPRVLPWVECPGAVASARRLAGVPLSGLRRHVRETFTGTGTCTHLNDTLRALEDVAVLLARTTV